MCCAPPRRRHTTAADRQGSTRHYRRHFCGPKRRRDCTNNIHNVAMWVINTSVMYHCPNNDDYNRWSKWHDVAMKRRSRSIVNVKKPMSHPKCELHCDCFVLDTALLCLRPRREGALSIGPPCLSVRLSVSCVDLSRERKCLRSPELAGWKIVTRVTREPI